jgi:hypothetical protein
MTAEQTAVIVAVVAGLGLLYLATCWLWPFAACRRCTGSGKRRAPGGKSWRDCPRCKGTGRRLRLGRRIANRLGRTRDHTNKHL